MTGKCKPGKVSRTVSTSPLTLDLTVKCTYGVEVPLPGDSTQVVLPPATVAHQGTAAGMSTPFVATPATVVEQLGFPTLWLVTSVVQTVVPVSLAHAAVGNSVRLVAALFTGGPHRMLRTRTVCSLCHRFHQDSSFGGADRLRLEGFYCRRR